MFLEVRTRGECWAALIDLRGPTDPACVRADSPDQPTIKLPVNIARSFFLLSSLLFLSLSLSLSFFSLCLSYASASFFLRLPPFPSLVSILTRLSYSSIQFLSSLPQFRPSLAQSFFANLAFSYTYASPIRDISMNIYDGDSPPLLDRKLGATGGCIEPSPFRLPSRIRCTRLCASHDCFRKIEISINEKETVFELKGKFLLKKSKRPSFFIIILESGHIYNHRVTSDGAKECDTSPPSPCSIKPSLSEQLKKKLYRGYSRWRSARNCHDRGSPLAGTSVYDALARASQRP